MCDPNCQDASNSSTCDVGRKMDTEVRLFSTIFKGLQPGALRTARSNTWGCLPRTDPARLIKQTSSPPSEKCRPSASALEDSPQRCAVIAGVWQSASPTVPEANTRALANPCHVASLETGEFPLQSGVQSYRSRYHPKTCRKRQADCAVCPAHLKNVPQSSGNVDNWGLYYRTRLG